MTRYEHGDFCPACLLHRLFAAVRALFCRHRRTVDYPLEGVMYEVLPSDYTHMTCLDCGSIWAERETVGGKA